eukprot:scaffold48347_cov68-Phaeocystis_antarctica.AAC.3
MPSQHRVTSAWSRPQPPLAAPGGAKPPGPASKQPHTRDTSHRRVRVLTLTLALTPTLELHVGCVHAGCVVLVVLHAVSGRHWVVCYSKTQKPSSRGRQPLGMGAAESLEASPPPSPEERRRGTHEWTSPSPARPAERRPPPRPEPAWEASRAATHRPSASAARHASPQRVAWGTPQSARSRVALAAEHESHGARGPYRRELLQESSGHGSGHGAARYASEHAAAAAAASPAARRAVAGSPRHLRSEYYSGGAAGVAAAVRGGAEQPGVELRLTRQQA